MTVLDLTLPTPAENLALDEALLDACEAGLCPEVLRFWEPSEYFVVVGYANRIDLEVNRAICREVNIPILRRCSGGGTVLQGPGSINYSLVLNIHNTHDLGTIPQTNSFVMNRQREAIASLVGSNVEVKGHTDLALSGRKFSGNAQRRKRDFLIFHGTFLLNFDLPMIEKLLRMPSKEPDYRSNRSHEAFLTNLQLPSESVKNALKKVWQASTTLQNVPDVQELVAHKYRLAEWNAKF